MNVLEYKIAIYKYKSIHSEGSGSGRSHESTVSETDSSVTDKCSHGPGTDSLRRGWLHWSGFDGSCGFLCWNGSMRLTRNIKDPETFLSTLQSEDTDKFL